MAKAQLPPAKSTTHVHLLSAINTELGRAPSDRLRLLDVGCGAGDLLTYLLRSLVIIQPSVELECFGFDVSDSGMLAGDLANVAIAQLAEVDPAVDWRERISIIRSTDPWPYPDEHFDVVVSNQVVEHVDDHELFFSELRRTLKEGGFSVHLFPLQHCLWEWHIKVPLYHRVRNHDMRTAYIKRMVQFGLKKPMLLHPDESIDDYAGREADMMRDFTNYLSQREVYRIGKRVKLRTSFRYTQEYYAQKVRSLAGRPPRLTYRRSRSALRDFIAVLLLRYVAAVTLVIEKRRGVPDEVARATFEAGRDAHPDGGK